MKRATVDTLLRINRDFYTERAEDFCLSRSRPWGGWQRVLEVTANLDAASSSLSILDVGCGNGRFGEYFAQETQTPARYLGLDSSSLLIEQARRRLSRCRRLTVDLLEVELTGTALQEELEGRFFDLIVVFGVLHHIAGLENRRRLLRRLAAQLEDGGVLAVSFWQFGSEERFQHRILDWGRYRSEAGVSLDLADLEPGDHLLAWGDSKQGDLQTCRYCHFATPAEAGSLIASLGLEVVDRYLADGRSGRLNLYFVVRSD